MKFDKDFKDYKKNESLLPLGLMRVVIRDAIGNNELIGSHSRGFI